MGSRKEDKTKSLKGSGKGSSKKKGGINTKSLCFLDKLILYNESVAIVSCNKLMNESPRTLVL
jgi:hypothetical protein